MIYANTVRQMVSESTFILPSELEIMKEYYENEITMLNSIIECYNINESTDLNIINESIATTIFNKIKELLRKFRNWIITFFTKVKNIIRKNTSDMTLKLNKIKKQFKDIDNDNILSDDEKEKRKLNIVKSIIRIKTKENINESTGTNQYIYYDYDKINILDMIPLNEICARGIEIMEIYSNKTTIRDIQRLKNEYKIYQPEKYLKEIIKNSKKIGYLNSDEILEIGENHHKFYNNAYADFVTYENQIQNFIKNLEKQLNKVPDRYKDPEAFHRRVNEYINYLTRALTTYSAVLDGVGFGLTTRDV